MLDSNGFQLWQTSPSKSFEEKFGFWSVRVLGLSNLAALAVYAPGRLVRFLGTDLRGISSLSARTLDSKFGLRVGPPGFSKVGGVRFSLFAERASVTAFTLHQHGCFDPT